ncbi:glycosyltransferase family 4 protein [uncultured Desulfosarcina sp.]|uniref:glycosyltransferase family 4 protein n=1 Tax=uncultured Desulfosarcina sp. TaxID=218289 RepID=UPI0029C6E97A|nr:glycosyltransferase family 4 protein [uncultured Desulfosarcina sp.]
MSELMKKGGLIHLFRQNRLRAIGTIFVYMFMLRGLYNRHNNVDIYHINWLQNALPLFGTTGRKAAIVSVLGSDMGLLQLPGMKILLRQVFKSYRTILAPNAEWMQDVLIKEFGDVARIVVIPLGIDQRWYAVLRSENIFKEKKWIVVARLTRKKIGPLFDWGENLFKGKTENQLHLFGPMQEEIEIPDWVYYHGAATPKELMEKWFPQATGLISLSRHDEGRPQVMIEAMASGVPIVASKIPAHINLLQHRKTGWIVGDRMDFSHAIAWLSDPEKNNFVASNAREWVISTIGTWKTCAERYYRLYDELLMQ